MAVPIRKKMFRFSIENDIQLLSSVVAINPLSGDATNKWSSVAEDIMDTDKNIFIDGRRCRERTHLLLSYFKADNREKLYKSGSTEDYNQKKQLLQEVSDMSAEYIKKPAESSSKTQAAIAIRKKAMETLKPSSTIQLQTKSNEKEEEKESEQPGPMPQKRRNSMSVVEYLREKKQEENETEQQRLNVERERLEIEKQKQLLEQERFKLEKQERMQMINLLSSLLPRQ